MSADAFALFAHATASALRNGNIYFVTNQSALNRRSGYHSNNGWKSTLRQPLFQPLSERLNVFKRWRFTRGWTERKGNLQLLKMKQPKGVSYPKSLQPIKKTSIRVPLWALAKSAILHSCIMGQESKECYHNAQLCKHSFGKGFCSGLFGNSFLPIKSIIKQPKKVLQTKRSGTPSKEREQRQDKGCFVKNSWVGVARD